MRDYELMTIHRPDLAEDEVEAKIGELETYLTTSDAEVTKRDLWGKRRFAYEIDHLSEGYYSVVSFKAGADAVAGVDRLLSFADEVVRHKIVRLEKDVLQPKGERTVDDEERDASPDRAR